MLKTISAALLAASIIAAPAMAAGTGKTDAAPVTKSQQATPATTNAKPSDAKTSDAKNLNAKTLNAKASMHKRHHVRHSHLRHHRSHMQAAVKKHTIAHVVKAPSTVKRLSSAKPVTAKVRG